MQVFADSELTAFEQEILDKTIQSYLTIDLNYNGKCDPEERALVMAASDYFDFDFDGDGRVDSIEFIAGESQRLDANNFLNNYRNANPGPVEGKTFRIAIETEMALDMIGSFNGVLGQPGWRDKLLLQLVNEEDKNKNGLLDHEELMMRMAFDKALLTLFGPTVRYDFDMDGNGGVDKKERDVVFDVLKSEFDLDGDGNISCDELLLLEWLPDSIRQGKLQGPSLPLVCCFKQSLLAFSKKFLAVYDRNKDGKWQPLELAYANKTEITLRNFFYRLNNRDMPFSAKAREELVKKLLVYRDINANGLVDCAEIPYERWNPDHPDFGPDPLDILIGCQIDSTVPSVPHKIMESLRDPRSSIVRISQNQDIDPETLSGCMRSLLALYDSNHDKKIDNEEAWVGKAVEDFLRKSFCKEKASNFSLKIRQIWIFKFTEMYDMNHDGRLDVAEALKGMELEKCWIEILRLNEENKRYDKDGNGWLDAKERMALESKVRINHDYNHNGVVELRELKNFLMEEEYKTTLFKKKVLTLDEQSLWSKTRKMFDYDHDGRVDIGFFPESSMLYDRGKTGDLTYEDLCRWYQFMLTNYDRNKDGQVNMDEVYEYSKLSMLWRQLAQCKNIPPVPASLPGLQQWALTFGDIDGNQKLSMDELQQLVYFQEKRRQCPQLEFSKALFDLQKIDANNPSMAELSTMQAFQDAIYWLAPLHPKFSKKGFWGRSDAETLEFAQILLQTEDHNHNGRIDWDESTRLLIMNYAKVEDRLQKEKQEQERLITQQQRQQEIEWLKKYDLNGNGKLDPEERARAEQDGKQGIQAPAIDE
jgi:Ca2+-binding EF-hand superfamily protein